MPSSQSGSTRTKVSPFWITSSVSAPSATPSTEPAPPRIATPPTTTEAITVNSKPIATRASIVA